MVNNTVCADDTRTELSTHQRLGVVSVPSLLCSFISKLPSNQQSHTEPQNITLDFSSSVTRCCRQVEASESTPSVPPLPSVSPMNHTETKIKRLINVFNLL